MTVDSANAAELANIARELGATVIEGSLRFPSEEGGWAIGSVVDFTEEVLAHFRDRKVMVIIADLGQADEVHEEYTCGICGFVMNELGECPRCKLQNALLAQELQERTRRLPVVAGFEGTKAGHAVLQIRRA